MQAQSPELGQVRILKDAKGLRSSYDEFVVGQDLGTAVLYITPKDIEAACTRMDFYHPWYSVNSPFGGPIFPTHAT